MMKYLKSSLPSGVKNVLKIWFDLYSMKSYSQEGEDMILRRIFEKEPPSFYVDVGAHHPQRFSNTFYFYKKGWMGINIDAMPGSMRSFRKNRPRDINIESAVGNESREMTYYIYDEPALNTFDEKLVNQRSQNGGTLIDKKKIVTKRLRDILADNMPSDTSIKFMSIDVEGLDFDVIQSNDWDLFRPEYLLIESHEKTLKEIESSMLYQFMINQGYVLFAKTVLTLIFKNDRVT